MQLELWPRVIKNQQHATTPRNKAEFLDCLDLAKGLYVWERAIIPLSTPQQCCSIDNEAPQLPQNIVRVL